MKTKLLGLAKAIRLSGLVAAGLLFSASPGAATTYTYSGLPLSTSYSCSGGLACGVDGTFNGPVWFYMALNLDMSGKSGNFSTSDFGLGFVDTFLFFSLGGEPYGAPGGPGTYLYADFTLSNGWITDWSIHGGDNRYFPLFYWNVSITPSGDEVDYHNGWFDDNSSMSSVGYAPPGVWSVDALTFPSPEATPLPAALPLFATGLAALGLLARRRKRNKTTAFAA